MGDVVDTKSCSGYIDCKSRIDKIEFRIEFLEKEKVGRETIHQLNLEMQRIASALEEVKNNRKEDREQISKINDSIKRLEDMITNYIEKMTEAILGTEAVRDLMVEYKSSLDRWQDAENSKFINIYKRWSSRTKTTKAISFFINMGIVVGVITLIFAVYIDAINGNANTSTWDMFMEFVRALRGV